jgi:NAD(P)-dependent dehydrogenase (short-subunit alcohol dehydrogenase family)
VPPPETAPPPKGRRPKTGTAPKRPAQTSGIGLATALELGALGAEVFICARTAEGVAAALSELRAAGVAAHGCAADVSDRAACEALVASVREAFGGKLHILGARARAGRRGGRLAVGGGAPGPAASSAALWALGVWRFQAPPQPQPQRAVLRCSAPAPVRPRQRCRGARHPIP